VNKILGGARTWLNVEAVSALNSFHVSFGSINSIWSKLKNKINKLNIENFLFNFDDQI
jgi:hypothetical protein